VEAADFLRPGGSEVRTGAERLHRFADMSAVEGFLEELAARPADKGGRTFSSCRVHRVATRAHLLCGPIDVNALPVASDTDRSQEAHAGVGDPHPIGRHGRNGPRQHTIYLRYFEIIRVEWLHSIVGAPDRDG